MFSRLLIANRGEIACRVIMTARHLGIETVAVYSDADRNARHVAMADRAVHIGPAPARESYLRADAIIDAARRTGAQAIHPGYGFLAENADFAEAVAQAGLVFVGPPPAAIRAMGLKDGAKRLMEQAGVPVVPGYHGDNQDADFLAGEAGRIGYPVLIKAVAGGGGKGMRRVDSAKDFADALSGARREAAAAFGDDRVLIEKFVTHPRHVEIQVFADSHGNAVHLFERDCSLQRRHQKVVEEAPAPDMPPEVRELMGKAATDAAKAIGYEGAGTVEFIADGSHGLRPDGFYFMEMNTRLQVEHPVTEEITGQDLVEWQLRVASGEPLPLEQDLLDINGHAMEVRLYAENPETGFLPSTGTLARLRLPEETDSVRIETGVREGDEVSVHYDPMIAKLVVWGETRKDALRQLSRALGETQIAGLSANVAFLKRLIEHPDFAAGKVDTGLIDRNLEALVPARDGVPERIRLLAILFLVLNEARSCAGSDPWDAGDGWRVSGGAVRTLRFDGDHGFEARVSYRGPGALGVSLDGQDHDIEGVLEGDGMLEARIGGETRRAGALLIGRDIVVIEEGETFVLTPHDPQRAAEAETGGASRITAPMPGKVISVLVSEGDSVERGQALVVLEAMKMEHTLKAGRDAVVEAVSARPGDQVGEGALLVTLAEAE